MAEAQGAEKTGGKKGKGPLLWVLLGVLMLALGGGGAFFFFSRGKSAPKDMEAKVEKAHSAPAAEGHGESKESAEPGVISLEPFLTNLAEPDVDRYVKCTVRLELDAKETAEKVKASELHLTRVRDRILTLLSGKRLADISSQTGKEGMKAEIQAQVDPLLDGGHIKEVYFTEFLVQ